MDKLFLGLSDQGLSQDPRQFVGSITNVKLFEDDGTRNIQQMAKHLCVLEADIVTTKSKWYKQGIVKENNVDPGEVCYEKQTYRVAIPAQMDLMQGLEICRKLYSGNMVELKDMEDVEFTLAFFVKDNSSCKYLWTPLTYEEEEEGQYKNINTGALVSYLPWKSGFPIGLGNVFLKLVSKDYLDFDGILQNTCNACDLPTTAIFSLNGVCKDTYLGEKGKGFILF